MSAPTICPLCGDTMTREPAQRCRERPTSIELLTEPESNWDSLPERDVCDRCGHTVNIEDKYAEGDE